MLNKFPKIDFQKSYEEGRQAAFRGDSLDLCPYRLPSLMGAWLSGFYDAILNQKTLPISETKELHDTT